MGFNNLSKKLMDKLFSLWTTIITIISVLFEEKKKRPIAYVIYF